MIIEGPVADVLCRVVRPAKRPMTERNLGNVQAGEAVQTIMFGLNEVEW